MRDEAIALAARIRRTRAARSRRSARAEDVFDGAGEERCLNSERDPTEAIWMKALQVGSFEPTERYWLGCFQPVGGDAERWRGGLTALRKRPGLERIAEVRFRDGQIVSMTHQQIVNGSVAALVPADARDGWLNGEIVLGAGSQAHPSRPLSTPWGGPRPNRCRPGCEPPR